MPFASTDCFSTYGFKKIITIIFMIQGGKQGGWRRQPGPQAPQGSVCSGGWMARPWEQVQTGCSPLHFLFVPQRALLSLLLQPALSRPLIQKLNHIGPAHRARRICNDLFTSLWLPLPDPALPEDKGHVVFSFACSLLPHTAWHTAGPVIACKPQDSSPS